jgi:hypothetical protein
VRIREGEMEMGTGGSRGKWWNGEIRTGAALLSLYALALLLADPEWAMWAGAMSAGALPSEIPPSLSHTSADLFAGAGTFSALGLGAFVALLAIRGEIAWYRILAWCEREWNRWCHGSVPRRP